MLSDFRYAMRTLARSPGFTLDDAFLVVTGRLKRARGGRPRAARVDPAVALRYE